MRNSNTFKATNTFSILSGDAHNIATIVNHFGRTLVSISHEAGKGDARNTYVVRTANPVDGLWDFVVIIDHRDRVNITERALIFGPKAAA